MRARAPLSTSLILGLALAAPVARAELAVKPAVKVWPGQSGLALDAAGVPHLSFASPKRAPFHAERMGRKFVVEAVAEVDEAGFDSAIAVAPGGALHLAYRDELPFELVYAVSTGAAFQVEKVDDGGFATSLALDGDERAHLLHVTAGGSLRYAVQQAPGWQLADTGLAADPLRPTQLALDAAGDAHASYVRDTGAYYASDASGAFVETPLDADGALAALALDAAGRPRVAVLTPAQVVWFHHDGAAWSSEVAFDLAQALPFFRFEPDGIALALDAGDRPFLLVTFLATLATKGQEILLLLRHDGEAWRSALLAKKDAGFHPRLVAAPGGGLHGTWQLGAPNSPSLLHGVFTFPDLAGAWSGVSEAGGVVRGTLAVENRGTQRAQGVPVALYRSGDAVLDAGDVFLGPKPRLRSLAPGAASELSVEVELAGDPSGEYLIAVIDPERKLEDLDRRDNTLAAPIP